MHFSGVTPDSEQCKPRVQCSDLAAHRTRSESLFLEFGSQLFKSNTATCVLHISNQISAQTTHISASTKSDTLTTGKGPSHTVRVCCYWIQPQVLFGLLVVFLQADSKGRSTLGILCYIKLSYATQSSNPKKNCQWSNNKGLQNLYKTQYFKTDI